jgi:hypothetical protein
MKELEAIKFQPQKSFAVNFIEQCLGKTFNPSDSYQNEWLERFKDIDFAFAKMDSENRKLFAELVRQAAYKD